MYTPQQSCGSEWFSVFQMLKFHAHFARSISAKKLKGLLMAYFTNNTD